jgi:periplasmic copper chaperone A
VTSRDAPPRARHHIRAHIRRDPGFMRKSILEILAAAALTLAAILSLAAGARANDIMVTGAYARASATPSVDRLLGASAGIAEEAMMHRSEMKDGMATMSGVDSLDIAPGAELAFSPGGYHLMLIGLKKPLKEGDHFSLSLRFEHAGDVTIDVPVSGVAADSPP